MLPRSCIFCTPDCCIGDVHSTDRQWQYGWVKMNRVVSHGLTNVIRKRAPDEGKKQRWQKFWWQCKADCHAWLQVVMSKNDMKYWQTKENEIPANQRAQNQTAIQTTLPPPAAPPPLAAIFNALRKLDQRSIVISTVKLSPHTEIHSSIHPLYSASVQVLNWGLGPHEDQTAKVLIFLWKGSLITVAGWGD